MTKYRTLIDNQDFINYVSKLKNNGALAELKLKQRLKCYGNPLDTMSHPVDKIKHWFQASTHKTEPIVLADFADRGELC